MMEEYVDNDPIKSPSPPVAAVSAWGEGTKSIPVDQPKQLTGTIETQDEVKKQPKLPYCVATAGPGPATYKLPPLVGYKDHDPSKWRGPAFSLVGRGSLTRRTDGDGPGPKYHVRQTTRFGVVTTPSVKFQKGGGASQARVVEEPRKMLGFQEEKRKPLPHEMKGFTLAGRHYLTPKGFTPAPNQYKLPESLGFRVPDLKRAPAYSIQSRPYMSVVHRAPGPAEYTAVDCKYYKKEAPRPVMTAKIFSKYTTDIPGPTTYMVKYNLVLPHAPKVPFGLKHTICAGTMRTPADDNLNNTR